MLRGVTTRSPRRLGLAEVIISFLIISLLFSLLALRRLESERDEWRDRLFLTLKSTSESARASEKRLKVAMDFITQQEDGLESKNSGQFYPQALPSEKQLQNNPPNDDTEEFPINGNTTLILFCYNRADYLRRTMDSLTSRLERATGFMKSGMRIIISQDGYDGRVRQTAEAFVQDMRSRGVSAEHIQHVHIERREMMHMAPYYALSLHYSKGLDYAFRDGSKRVIVLEDDLELAVDFFPFFQAFATLLDEDESLMAVSAWNDHGQESHVSDAKMFYRTDIFPGLGWMMPERLWAELKPKWPEAFWDDWLRNPDQRKGRHVIRPEISRTITFGVSGASQGQFFSTFLKTMKLNTEVVKYNAAHVDAMKKYAFDKWFMAKVNAAKKVSDLRGLGPEDTEVRVEYADASDFQAVATRLQIMDDIKFGLPRGSYRGILPVRVQGRQVYVSPRTIPSLD